MEETKTEEVKEPEKASETKNTAMAIIAYFLFFVPLLTESKNDSFVKYHVKQSIVLVILAVCNSLLGRIIPFWGFLGLFISLGLFILWILGVINAANGKAVPVPVVGKYAEQYLKF